MSEILEQSTDEVERLLAEMKSHGGEFVARDEAGGALAYGESEDELAIQLAEQGLHLWDVLVSRVPKWDCCAVI